MAVVDEFRKRLFTVDEFYRMGENGVFEPDERVELIEGEVITMEPIGPFHGDVLDDLVSFFCRLSDGRRKVMNQRPLSIDERSLPQPDLMLVQPGAGRYRKRHARPDEVFLLVEISDSTLRLDRERKLPLYGRAGISEVWIINLQKQCIEIHREPNFTGYGSMTVVKTGQAASPAAFPEIKINVGDLLALAGS